MNSSKRLIAWLLSISALVPSALLAQQAEVFYIERGHEVYQNSATTVIPVDQHWLGSEPSNFSFGAGAMVTSGTISDFRIANSVYPAGVTIPWSEDDGYDLWMTFSTQAELTGVAPAGTYTLSGTGSTVGGFSHAIELAAYTPQTIKKFVNYDALQSFDPDQDLVIQWEPFADAGEVLAFIEVEVRYWTGSYDVYVWDSEEDPRHTGFGLPPETTSVTVPAGSIVGSPWNSYSVGVTFLRVDTTASAPKFPDAIFAGVTTLNVYTEIHAANDVPSRIFLAPGQWSHYGKYSWLFGLSQDWGYSFHLGYINVRHTPAWIYQASLGWIYCLGELEQGMWFYHPLKGWLYTPANYGGWYRDMQGNWDNMINPKS